MCRITGIAFNKKHFQAIDNMTNSLTHGGPDDHGIWHDEYAALGHRRLAINDLSPLGHQPMLSPSQRYITVFNGEIYNFQALRTELEKQGYRFQGHSDTEVLLASIENWGFKQSLQKFNGMFAFALWDREEKKLHLACDRFGEKPLYYGVVNGTFLFASELKAFKHYPDFKPSIDSKSIECFLRYAYIQAPQSIYAGIFKLEPGHMLSIGQDLQIQKSAYWSCETAILAARSHPYTGSFKQATADLDHILTEAVTKRMVSDVPLGAFLSGGIDSSAIVALMQKVSKNPIKTFSIGFEAKAYNEAPFAKEIASHLGTDHQELYVSEQDLLNVIPQLPRLYDEPFADSSQIPTFLVSKMAKQQVTVVLSGDAGDEVFGGYTRYFLFNRLQKFLRLPLYLRKMLAKSIRLSPVPAMLRPKLNKLAEMLQLPENSDLYQLLISQNHQHLSTLPFAELEPLSLIENLMYWDTISYLPGDILTKVDRASMANALETRVPFLDPTLFDFAWRLPLEYKIKRRQGKLVLKEMLYHYVPKTLLDRPKAGFGIPIHDWLRGPLKEWGSDLLNDAASEQHECVNRLPIKKMWQAHLSKKQDMGYALWNILMLQSWLRSE